MNFLLLLLATCWLSNAAEAASSTRLKYLPNGQVGGYELIINNTERHFVHPIYHPTKVVKQTSHVVASSGSTYTLVDERVVGGRVYLNVQSVFSKPPEVKKKYPVKTVLKVPSVQYKNGVPEEVELTLAQVGPYAVLLVPIKNGTEFGNVARTVDSVPSEVRDSIKSFVQVSGSQTTGASTKGGTNEYGLTGAVQANDSGSRSRPFGFGNPVTTKRNRYGPYEPPRVQDTPNLALDVNRGTNDNNQEAFYATEDTSGLDRGFVIQLAHENPANPAESGLKGFVQLLPKTEPARENEKRLETWQTTTQGPEITYPYEGRIESNTYSSQSIGVDTDLGAKDRRPSEGYNDTSTSPNTEYIDKSSNLRSFSSSQVIPTKSFLKTPLDPSSQDVRPANGAASPTYYTPLDHSAISQNVTREGRVYPKGPHTVQLIETLNGIVNQPGGLYVPAAGK